MDGLAFEGEEAPRFRPKADTALRLLLVVIRDERAGVVCMLASLPAVILWQGSVDVAYYVFVTGSSDVSQVERACDESRRVSD